MVGGSNHHSDPAWMKYFGEGYADEDVFVSDRIERTSDVIKKAATTISSVDEERRYIDCIKDIECFIPTRDTSSIWLQCFADGARITQNVNSASIQQSLGQSYAGLAQGDLDHERLTNDGISLGFTIGKWMIKTTEEHVDGIWRMLAGRVLDGSLAGADGVKCATRRNAAANASDGHCYTLCVYTNDGLANRGAVLRLREVLHELKIDEKCIRPLYWKPDLYTLLPLSGKTHLWIDGVDTKFWFDHWGNESFLPGGR